MSKLLVTAFDVRPMEQAIPLILVDPARNNRQEKDKYCARKIQAGF